MRLSYVSTIVLSLSLTFTTPLLASETDCLQDRSECEGIIIPASVVQQQAVAAPAATTKGEHITKVVILAGLGALTTYDIVAVSKGWHDTISKVTWDATKAHPWILFLAGWFCGHLFWH